jgi:hypothetical protein
MSNDEKTMYTMADILDADKIVRAAFHQSCEIANDQEYEIISQILGNVFDHIDSLPTIPRCLDSAAVWPTELWRRNVSRNRSISGYPSHFELN